MSLLLDRGAAATDELREVAAAQERLVAELDVGEADRTAALDRIAALAARMVPLEREACAALAEV
jgi:hypothetical protein